MLLNIVGRGARHGHQMNGKLARLAQQEADELSTRKSDAASSMVDRIPVEECQRKCTRSKKKKKKLKRTGTEDS